MLERVWRKGNPPTLLEECKLVQPLWKSGGQFLKNLKAELPYDPEIPLRGIYPEKTMIQKDTCTPVFTAALLMTAPRPESKPSVHGPMTAYRCGAYIQSILLSHKKNEITPPAATQMDPEIITLSQKEKDI